MSDPATLRTKLRAEASIEESEGFDDARLDTWFKDAVLKHNSAYTVATLPEEEEEAVVVLAWISVCYARASKVVNSASITGGNGYGADRTNPYNQNMNMAATLQRRYDMIVSEKASDDSSSVMMGQLNISSDRTDRVTSGPNRPFRIALLKKDVTSADLVLYWTAQVASDFCDYYLYVSTSPILQDWNFKGNNGVPRINQNATLLAKIETQDLTTLKVEDLEPSTTYYFILVMKNRRSYYYYSNEVIATTTA